VCGAVYCMEGYRSCFCAAAIVMLMLIMFTIVVRAKDASGVNEGRLEGLANGAGGVVELD